MMPPDSLILVSVGFHLPCYIFSSETPFSPLRNTALPDSCDLWLLARGVAVSCLFSGLAPVGSFYWWGPQGHPQVRGSLGVGTASVLQPKDTKGSGLRKSDGAVSGAEQAQTSRGPLHAGSRLIPPSPSCDELHEVFAQGFCVFLKFLFIDFREEGREREEH